MEIGRKPKDWLKEKQTATAEDLSNDIWIRIERVNRVLEKYGRGDFIKNMPVLFAMYYYTVVTVMQIPEQPTGIAITPLADAPALRFTRSSGSLTLTGNGSVTATDTAGRTLLRRASSGENTLSLAPGVYIIRRDATDGKVYTWKVEL